MCTYCVFVRVCKLPLLLQNSSAKRDFFSYEDMALFHEDMAVPHKDRAFFTENVLFPQDWAISSTNIAPQRHGPFPTKTCLFPAQRQPHKNRDLFHGQSTVCCSVLQCVAVFCRANVQVSLASEPFFLGTLLPEKELIRDC